MKSPLTISYQDLIKASERRLKYMEENYPRMKREGKVNANTADHNIACEKVLLKMLKQSKRGQQLDMWEAFEKVKQ